jgi:hypothetical protein
MKRKRGMRLPWAGLLLLMGWLALQPSPVAAQKRSRWNGLSPRERYDTMRNYREYENLPEERKEDIDRRYERWRQMPKDKRERVLQNFERYQQMPPQEREELQRKYHRWKSDAPPPEGYPKKGKRKH